MAKQQTKLRYFELTEPVFKSRVTFIYRAFIEDQLEAPKHLARAVHAEYFNPQLPDFVPRTAWSLQNAFTAAFKSLEPIPLYKATASLGEFFTSKN